MTYLCRCAVSCLVLAEAEVEWEVALIDPSTLFRFLVNPVVYGAYIELVSPHTDRGSVPRASLSTALAFFRLLDVRAESLRAITFLVRLCDEGQSQVVKLLCITVETA